MTLVNILISLLLKLNEIDLPKNHPNKEIQKAIDYAVAKNWRIQDSGKSSHAWGRLKCPETSRLGCIISVWSTPRVPDNHARQIIRTVDKCTHC